MRNKRPGQKGTALTLLVSCLALVLFLIALYPLATRSAGWFFFSKKTPDALISATRFDRGNSGYHFMLGKYYHLGLESQDLAKAISSYEESLRLNPLQSQVWSLLSRAYQMSGKAAEAERALERAVKLNPNNPGLLWEAGSFWLMNNMTGKAVHALNRYLLLEPAMQPVVYDLCWRLGLENSYIMQQVVPQAYKYQAGYLGYLMATRRADEAQEAWKSLDQTVLEKEHFITYVNFLIENSLYGKAETIWNEVTSKIDGMRGRDANTLLWNHGFESDPLNGGFDWRIAESEGVNTYIDDSTKMTGSRSLGVAFDGRHNPDVTIAAQIVPVAASARYNLRAYLKADSITTKNGVFMQVQGHRCEGLSARTDSVIGSSLWREVSLDFEVPASCNAAVIMIRRERSQKLDNKIEGTAWIDGIILKPQAVFQTSSSKKPSK